MRWRRGIAVDTVIDYVANRAVSTTWPYGYDGQASPAANLLRTAVQVANTRVFETAATSHDYAGMGTTVVAALVRDNVATIAHVGDSRAYAIGHRRAWQLTVDDSWTEAMLARDPDISPDILKRHPMRNALTSVVGSRAKVDVHVAEHVLTGHEVLLLTTDGVHGVLEARDLVRACELAGDVQSIAAGLVQAAMDTGSRDNCTAVARDTNGVLVVSPNATTETQERWLPAFLHSCVFAFPTSRCRLPVPAAAAAGGGGGVSSGVSGMALPRWQVAHCTLVTSAAGLPTPDEIISFTWLTISSIIRAVFFVCFSSDAKSRVGSVTWQ